MRFVPSLFLICTLVFIRCSNSITTPSFKQSAEESQSTIDNCWILESTFLADTLIFKRIAQVDTNETWLKQFTFNAENVDFKYLRAVPRCGVGLISIDSVTGSISDSTIDLYLEGSSMDFSFTSYNSYKIEKSSNHQMVLLKQKEIINEFEQKNVILIE